MSKSKTNGLFYKTASAAQLRAFRLMQAANMGGASKRGKLTIPDKCYPPVRALFETLNREMTTVKEIGEKSGVHAKTISQWRYRNNPIMPLFESVMNALGYELVIVKRRGPRTPKKNSQIGHSSDSPTDDRIGA